VTVNHRVAGSSPARGANPASTPSWIFPDPRRSDAAISCIVRAPLRQCLSERVPWLEWARCSQCSFGL